MTALLNRITAAAKERDELRKQMRAEFSQATVRLRQAEAKFLCEVEISEALSLNWVMESNSSEMDWCFTVYRGSRHYTLNLWEDDLLVAAHRALPALLDKIAAEMESKVKEMRK